MNVQEIAINGPAYPDDGQIRVSPAGTGDQRNVFRGHRFVGMTWAAWCEYGHTWYRAELPHHARSTRGSVLPGYLACPVDPQTRHNGGYTTMEAAAQALADRS